MLGIIFTGGGTPPADVTVRLVEREAKGALLIAADSGFTAAQNAGLPPDWIIGDMDSIGGDSRFADWPPQRVIRYEHDKDCTDTELAFSLAVEKGCDKIWIIGGGGGRIDHLFAIRSLFERDVFPLRWITEAADIRCLEAAALSTVLDKGAVVSVFPLGSGQWEAESEGLKWPLAGLPWDRGFFGLSNVAPNGEFSVRAHKGRFMVILPLPSIV